MLEQEIVNSWDQSARIHHEDSSNSEIGDGTIQPHEFNMEGPFEDNMAPDGGPSSPTAAALIPPDNYQNDAGRFTNPLTSFDPNTNPPPWLLDHGSGPNLPLSNPTDNQQGADFGADWDFTANGSPLVGSLDHLIRTPSPEDFTPAGHQESHTQQDVVQSGGLDEMDPINDTLAPMTHWTNGQGATNVQPSNSLNGISDFNPNVPNFLELSAEELASLDEFNPNAVQPSVNTDQVPDLPTDSSYQEYGDPARAPRGHANTNEDTLRGYSNLLEEGSRKRRLGAEFGRDDSRDGPQLDQFGVPENRDDDNISAGLLTREPRKRMRLGSSPSGGLTNGQPQFVKGMTSPIRDDYVPQGFSTNGPWSSGPSVNVAKKVQHQSRFGKAANVSQRQSKVQELHKRRKSGNNHSSTQFSDMNSVRDQAASYPLMQIPTQPHEIRRPDPRILNGGELLTEVLDDPGSKHNPVSVLESSSASNDMHMKSAGSIQNEGRTQQKTQGMNRVLPTSQPRSTGLRVGRRSLSSDYVHPLPHGKTARSIPNAKAPGFEAHAYGHASRQQVSQGEQDDGSFEENFSIPMKTGNILQRSKDPQKEDLGYDDEDDLRPEPISRRRLGKMPEMPMKVHKHRSVAPSTRNLNKTASRRPHVTRLLPDQHASPSMAVSRDSPADSVDYREVAPGSDEEREVLDQVLQPTKEAYFEWLGEPTPLTFRHESYMSQHEFLQNKFNFAWGLKTNKKAPRLFQLPAWGMSIENAPEPQKDELYFEPYFHGYRAPRNEHGRFLKFPGEMLEIAARKEPKVRDAMIEAFVLTLGFMAPEVWDRLGVSKRPGE